MAPLSPLARKLVQEGLRGPGPHRAFADFPPELRAAVEAYDEARRTATGRYAEPPMSEANKATIAPFIMAAVVAYAEARARAKSGRSAA